MKKRVAVFGVFDLLHEGHKNFLRQAKELGEELIVIMTDDDVVFSLKAEKPHDSFSVRMKKLKEENIADNILAGDKRINEWKVLKELQPQVVALGYDQEELFKALTLIKGTFSFPFEIVRLAPHESHIFHTKFLRKR